MIDVPARVKDALKSGDYKKNVKITVPNVVLGYDIVRTDEPISTQQTYTEVWESMEIVGWEVEAGANFFVSQKTDKLRIIANHTFTYWAITYNDTVISQGAPDEAGGTVITTDCPDVPSEVPASAYHLILYIKTNSYQDKPSLLPVVFEYLDEDHVIDNNNLVAESVKFDERMCSDTELKFGLCEGTSVEFQYFDLPNIRGEHISISIDVQYKDTDGNLAWYEIPMGQYDVDECSRQASTGIIKATAYNKLQSNYLDRDVLSDVYDYVYAGTDHSRKIVDILNYLLNGYHIEKTDWEEVECQLCPKATNPENGINSGMFWQSISYYTPDSGQWKPYEKGYSDDYPYDFPNGARWVIYAADYYYKPSNDTGSVSTNHYYKYDELQLKAIWDIVKENLYRFLDYTEMIIRVVEEATNPTIFMPSQGPHFGVNNMEFLDYAITQATDDDPENRISGFFGQASLDRGTSVAGHNGPVNYAEFTGEYPCLRVPLAIVVQHDDYIGVNPPNPYNIQAVWNVVVQRYTATYQALQNITLPKMYKKQLSPIEEETISASEINNLQSLTLRDLQSAAFEIDCQYGKLDRVSDLFSGIELNNGALYPRDDLYPADNLLPMGPAEAGYPAMYSKLWADEGNVRTFRNLIITYKGTETVEGQTQEVEKKLQRTVNANGTDDYNMSDNWLFKNLVWSDADVATYADAMVEKMQNMSWFPFEMWCAGLPYLEAGDAIEIAMQQGTYKSYVLRRNLNGIQNLQDEMINGTLDIF